MNAKLDIVSTAKDTIKALSAGNVFLSDEPLFALVEIIKNGEPEKLHTIVMEANGTPVYLRAKNKLNPSATEITVDINGPENRVVDVTIPHKFN